MPADTKPFVREQIAVLCGLPADAIADDGPLIGYGMDSVRLIDLIISLEEEYDLEISEQDPRLGGVKTLDDLVGYVDARRAEG